MSKELEQDMENQHSDWNIHNFDRELHNATKPQLSDTIKSLIKSLKYELEYAEEIQAEMEEHPHRELSALDIEDNLDYLIRDLNPEYEMQQGNFDYFSRELKKVQDTIKAHNKEEDYI